MLSRGCLEHTLLSEWKCVDLFKVGSCSPGEAIIVGLFERGLRDPHSRKRCAQRFAEILDRVGETIREY